MTEDVEAQQEMQESMAAAKVGEEGMEDESSIPVDSTDDAGGAETGGGDDADLEIEEMQRKVQEMEEEAEKLKKMTDQVEDAQPNGNAAANAEDVDKKSIYIGNVDYASTPQELQEHFKSCGDINRITILVDKWSGHPKGFAYMEFGEDSAVQNACLLNDSLFRNRQLKVTPKRTNVPGFNAAGQPIAAKGGKGKGKGKGFKGKGKGTYDWSGGYGGGYRPARPRGRFGGGYRPY